MSERLSTWFWQRVSWAVAGEDGSLWTLRWVIGLYLLLIEAPHYAWLGDAPQAFFDPPVFSLGFLAGGFPPRPFFLALDLIAITAIVAMVVGVRTRLATAVVALCRLIGTSFLFAFGKIDHTIMLTLFLALMAYCDWGRAPLGPDALEPGPLVMSRRAERARSLFAVALAFGFLTAGLPKLLRWVDFDASTSGMLSWYYEGVFDLRRDRLLAGWVPGLPAWLLEIIDVAAVLVEVIGFLALLLGRLPWRQFLLLVSALHLANALVLNIEFNAQALTYLAFVGLTVGARDPRSWGRPALWAVAATAAAWHVQARLRGGGSAVAGITDYRAQLDIGLVAAMVVGAVTITLFAREMLRRPAGG